MRGVLGLLLIVGGFALVILMLTGHLTFPGVNVPASTPSGQPQSPGTPHTVQAGAATGGSGAGGGF